MGDTFNAFVKFISDDPIMLGLCIAIIVLVIAFIIVLILGRKKETKDERKLENTSELLKTEINLDTLKSTQEYSVSELQGLTEEPSVTETVEESPIETTSTSNEPALVEEFYIPEDDEDTSLYRFDGEVPSQENPVETHEEIKLETPNEPKEETLEHMSVPVLGEDLATKTEAPVNIVEQPIELDEPQAPVEPVHVEEPIQATEFASELVSPTLETREEDAMLNMTKEEEEAPSFSFETENGEFVPPEFDNSSIIESTVNPVDTPVEPKVLEKENYSFDSFKISTPDTTTQETEPVVEEKVEEVKEEPVTLESVETVEEEKTVPEATADVELPIMTEPAMDEEKLNEQSSEYSSMNNELPSFEPMEFSNSAIMNNIPDMKDLKEEVKEEEDVDLDLPKLNTNNSGAIDFLSSLKGESFDIK